jgi:hypothetical protein
MDNYSYRHIGSRYQVSKMCTALTYPCKHYVIADGKSPVLMDGVDIYCTLSQNGLSDDHFSDYAEFARRRHYPTEEEILQLQQLQQEQQKWQEKMERIRQEKYARLCEMRRRQKAQNRWDRLRQQKRGLVGEYCSQLFWHSR